MAARVRRLRRAPTRRGCGQPVRVHVGHHFWGMGNVGDDCMLGGFLKVLRHHGAEVRLSCCATGNLAQLTLRFPQIEWLPYTSRHRLDALCKADVWLGLGDTPFQKDAGGWMERHLDEERAMCVALGLPMHFLCVGVGDHEAMRSRAFRRVLDAASHVWARDEMSFELLSQRIPGRVSLAADLANILFREAAASARPSDTGPDIGLLLHFENPGVLTLEKLEGCLNDRPAPAFWVVQEQRAFAGSENGTWNSLPQALLARLRRLEPDWNAASLDELLRPWRFPPSLISSRYHGALWAAWQGCEVLIVARNEKLSGLARALQLETVDPESDWPQLMLPTRMRRVERPALEALAETAEAAVNEWLAHAAAPPSGKSGLRSFIYRFFLGAVQRIPPSGPRRHFRLTLLKLDKLGDGVLALGAIRRLTSCFGEANCLLVVSPIAEPLLRLEFPQAAFLILPAFCERFFPDFALTLLRHASALRAVRTDVLVCLRHHPSDYLHSVASLIHADKILATLWTGPQENTSLSFPRVERVPYPSRADGMPPSAEPFSLCLELHAHQRLVSRALGVSVPDMEMLPSFQHTEVQPGSSLLVCPAAGSTVREYPPHLMAETLRLFQAAHPAVPLRVCLPPGSEHQELERALQAAGIADVAWVFPGDICALLAEIAVAGAVLAPDSAPAHIATAQDKPGVFLLGGGHHGQFAPWSRSPRQRWLSHPLPCYQCEWRCVHAEALCITQISPQQIVAALREVLRP